VEVVEVALVLLNLVLMVIFHQDFLLHLLVVVELVVGRMVLEDLVVQEVDQLVYQLLVMLVQVILLQLVLLKEIPEVRQILLEWVVVVVLLVQDNQVVVVEMVGPERQIQ
tara:strand:+ start:183 stop:512 length:330 start_codon:yes stop_codon:yes gene_type:complete